MLSEAEGCFNLGFTAKVKYNKNYRVALMFTMSLHEKDKNLLIKLKEFFGVGNIIKHGPSSLQHCQRHPCLCFAKHTVGEAQKHKISSIKDISILISHCNNFPLISKRIDF